MIAIMRPASSLCLATTFLLFLTSFAQAQEAYIGQIGDGNSAANVDLSARSLMVTLQHGGGNSAAQLTSGRENILVTGQLGDGNASTSIMQGANNFVGTVQLGLRNVAFSDVRGSSNQIITFQDGDRNSSNLVIAANQSKATVSQSGNDLLTNLTLQDDFSLNNQTADPMNIGVFQSQGDDPVNASVTRDAAGTITVRPGTATTILKLPG
jgi:hypothetical protein